MLEQMAAEQGISVADWIEQQVKKENKMKEVTVTFGPKGNERETRVQLVNTPAGRKLTPKMAREAKQVAIGYGYPATVEGDGKAYRVYQRSVKKLKVEPDWG